MIILSLGSNLSSSYGDRFFNLDLALSYLNHYEIRITKQSSYFESPSYPNINNPKFINIVISVESDLDPVNFASVIIFIENKLERVRNKKNDPRTCDIDIIDFDRKVINFKYKNSDFSVPHKQLSYRNFVLYPLREILPKWTHPETNEQVGDLIKKLDTEDKKSILKVEKP